MNYTIVVLGTANPAPRQHGEFNEFYSESFITIIGVNFYKAAMLEPPIFQTPIGFRASDPPIFLSHATPIMKLSSVLYNKMTPNDIHANQTTSFVRIQQRKLQAVSRIVLEFFCATRYY